MNPYVTCDVIALSIAGPASIPVTRKTEVVFADASHMIIAEMEVQHFSIFARHATAFPHASKRRLLQ